MRKLLAVLLVGGFVGYMAWAYFSAEAKAGRGRSARSQIVAVETAAIKKADLSDKVTFTGSIKAAERYDAAPKISGILQRINFNVGDKVNLGDVIAVLDDDEHLLAVEQAEASLRVARAAANDAASQLEIIKRDYERAMTLRRELVISAQEFDRTDATFKAQQAKYETALAQVNQAETSLKTAQLKLSYTRVRADWNGGSDQRVIGQRYMDVGALVAVITPILSVLDITSVRAVIPVSEKEYPKITMNHPVTIITDAFPGRKFQGKVSRIPQELGALTREAEIEVEVDNVDTLLKPGMFVRADIEFARHTGVAAAPLSAIMRRDDGGRGVFVLDEGRKAVAFQPIVEGIADGNLVELVNGEELLGREVVTLGQHLLKDGMNVRVAGGNAQ